MQPGRPVRTAVRPNCCPLPVSSVPLPCDLGRRHRAPFPRLPQRVSGSPMRHPPSTPPLQARGLRRIIILVPIGCAGGLLLLARELRARQRAGTAAATPGWRRLSPSAELFVDSESGARCTVRDTGAHGMERYLRTVTVFGDHQLMEGRTGELTEARSQAETALSAYVRQARVV
jgi:hypothetical protein